ncbi:MAG TPA: PA2779 family protein [Terracidiphilus sp.]|nr:PA2779 family protein [Terracidiphilus sp.]
MHMQANPFLKVCSAAALLAAFAVPQSLAAQAVAPLVSSSDLQKATVDASHQREQNQKSLDRFFSSTEARQALESSHMRPEQVQKAVSGLSDQELAQLARRADTAQKDFAAGTISNRDLLLIIVAIAALILIIVAVH